MKRKCCDTEIGPHRIASADELETLKQAVREYLERPSCDGKQPERTQMRMKLAVLSV